MREAQAKTVLLTTIDAVEPLTAESDLEDLAALVDLEEQGGK